MQVPDRKEPPSQPDAARHAVLFDAYGLHANVPSVSGHSSSSALPSRSVCDRPGRRFSQPARGLRSRAPLEPKLLDGVSLEVLHGHIKVVGDEKQFEIPESIVFSRTMLLRTSTSGCQ